MSKGVSMSWLSKIFGRNKIEQTAKIVVLGSSGSGKTTLIRFLETGEPILEDPRTTLGIDIRKSPITIDGWVLSAIDVGGQDLYRESLWALGVSQADAVIYVLDGIVKPSTDSTQFELSKFSFDYMLTIVEKDVPLLLLVNKQDLTESKPISVQEAIGLYDMSNLMGRSFNVVGTSAKYGDGVESAVMWLIEKIAEKR